MSFSYGCDHVLIVCDRCGRGDRVQGDTRREHIEYAEDWGWHIGPDAGGDLCPFCIDEDQSKQNGERLKKLYGHLGVNEDA